MSDITIRVTGYVLFVSERRSFTLVQLRSLLPTVEGTPQRNLLDPAVVLAGHVSALVTVPKTCYPGSLGQLLEGFVCTFLDSLRPRPPEGFRGWRQALERWLSWPRDMFWDTEEQFEVGPAEIYGIVRLRSSDFPGEVTRAVLCQREPSLTPLTGPQADDRPWPRVMRLGGEQSES